MSTNLAFVFWSGQRSSHVLELCVNYKLSVRHQYWSSLDFK